MTFLVLLAKTLIIFAILLVMATPFLMEWATYTSDKENKISYKRFRVVVFTLIYVIGITIAMYLTKELFNWIGSWRLVQWLLTHAAIKGRFPYVTKLLAVSVINAAIGFLYVFLSKGVRIGLKKRDYVNPKKKNGEFSFGQKVVRKIISFFYNETWFFVAKLLKGLGILLSAAYIAVFTLYYIPAFFGASWIPYDFISMLFSAGYIYPTITLLVVWEAYYFLAGISRAVDECPDIAEVKTGKINPIKVDIAEIDAVVKKHFNDYYACDVKLSEALQDKLASTRHHEITGFIGAAVENDRRNPEQKKEVYLDCIDQIVKASEEEKSVIINGNFFSEFSMYFLRYLSIAVVRGDNVIFVCNDEIQIDAVYNYLNEALCELSSLYCKEFNSDAVDFDDPIWRIVKISGEHDDIDETTVDDNSILVTSLNYICSAHFEREHSNFIHLLDTVVFVDAMGTVNNYPRQLSLLNTRLRHITKNNALLAKNNKSGNFGVRYMSRQVRYYCFDDSRTPGLDKVLKNMLSVDFLSADAMNYSPSTLVRCYNYEGKPSVDGKLVVKQFVNTKEEVGAVVNMALLCLEKGAGNVTVFADGSIPYASIAETVDANSGQLSVDVDSDRLRINKRFYNPDDYSVIIAIDSGDNLPAAVRRYASMVSDKPALIMIFSRQYMMRDYYIDNIDKLWINDRILRVPVVESGKKEIAQKILVKANSGGITEEEILRLAEGVNEFKDYIQKKNVNGILRAVLELYGIMHEDALDIYNYFEYSSSVDFDEYGNYNPKDKVMLRRQGKLFDMLNCRDMAIMSLPEGEVPLSIPRGRITQNHIARQNLLYNGAVYFIERIDTATGRIYAKLATSGNNKDTYKYVQSREYVVGATEDKIEKVLPTSHTVIGRAEDNVSVNDVYLSVFRAPVEVHTSGYYEVDSYSLSIKKDSYHPINDKGNDEYAKETYRRYGKVRDDDSSEEIMKSTNLAVSGTGALMMSIRLKGQFGADVNRTMMLAAAMLSEIIHAMFPSVADSVAVCPVLHGESKADSELRGIVPKMTLASDDSIFSKEDFELVIIEDSDSELGVISVLSSSGENILETLFAPVYEYLTWYNNATDKSKFLYYTLEDEPACFDFDAVHKLATILGYNNREVRFEAIEELVEHVVCDFCGKRYAKNDGIVELEDGRKMCADCAAKLVENNRKTLKEYLDRAKIYLESTYNIALDEDYDFCFESTVKLVNTLKQNRDVLRRGADVPLKSYVENGRRVHVESSIPALNLAELLVRELTHVWQLKNLPDVSEEMAEGHIALVSVQYLRFLGQSALVSARTNYYESNSNLSGRGYRKLVSELLAKPNYNNNPFLYLIDTSGTGAEPQGVVRITPTIGAGDFGLTYTPDVPDRAADGNVSYFYYSHFTATEQTAYSAVLDAIKNHAPSVSVDGCTDEQIGNIIKAVTYDHPELFWYRTYGSAGGDIDFYYGASAEECDVLMRQIEESAAKYLEGIDDTMSAYDVAIRLHIKMINSVDYDTIALDKEDEEGTPDANEIDRIRSICGVFIDGKAVCAGYAKAMQFLLQKCGIESAYAAGEICKENGTLGGGHAWNIVKIDGDYYYLDTTWDDGSDTIQAVKNYDLGFSYFCITTDELLRSRNLARCPVEMPYLTATKANYYYRNGLVLESADVEKLKEFATKAATAKQRFFTFKCASKALYEQMFDKFNTNSNDYYDALRVAAKVDKEIAPNSYSYSYNSQIRTITIKFKYK